MRIQTREREMMSPAAVQKTLAVFENPCNLARIAPPWLNFRIPTPVCKCAAVPFHRCGAAVPVVVVATPSHIRSLP